MVDLAAAVPARPLLTAPVSAGMLTALRHGVEGLDCSLDLGRSQTRIELGATHWRWGGRTFPYLVRCKERTVYHWVHDAFEPVARYGNSLVKLVPTEWGPPTFEIDGIKMLPTAHVSPYDDARRKVELIQPRDKVILDTCGGLGYFAAWCLAGGARHVHSYEKNVDVAWLRGINPWSPTADPALTLSIADVTGALATMPDGSMDAVLHDPPRFGIAGELYSQDVYRQLARVLRRRGTLFHYTGSPNKIATGRNLALEVSIRLRNSGFTVTGSGDGLLAVKR